MKTYWLDFQARHAAGLERAEWLIIAVWVAAAVGVFWYIVAGLALLGLGLLTGTWLPVEYGAGWFGLGSATGTLLLLLFVRGAAVGAVRHE